MRILLVKTSSLGDVVHNLLASDLARRFPGITIDWVVEAAFAEIPRLHPAIDRGIPVAVRRWRRQLLSPATWREMSAFRENLRAETYDAVLDTQGLIKSGLMTRQARLAPGGQRLGYSREAAREPLAARFYERTYTLPKNIHAVERNRWLAAVAFGYAEELSDLPLDYGLAAPAAAAFDPSRKLRVGTQSALRHAYWRQNFKDAYGFDPFTKMGAGLIPNFALNKGQRYMPTGSVPPSTDYILDNYLSNKEKRVLVAHDMQKMTSHEIAQIKELGITVNQVQVILDEARRKYRFGWEEMLKGKVSEGLIPNFATFYHGSPNPFASKIMEEGFIRPRPYSGIRKLGGTIPKLSMGSLEEHSLIYLTDDPKIAKYYALGGETSMYPEFLKDQLLHAARLKLEQRRGTARLEQLKGGRIVERQFINHYRRQPRLDALRVHHLHRAIDNREIAQPQKVELHQTDVLDIFHVILGHKLMTALFAIKRHEIRECTRRNHDASGMFAGTACQAFEGLSGINQRAHILLVLKDRSAEVDDCGQITIELPLSRRDLAAMLGARPESLSRMIRDFHDAGIAKFGTRVVIVPDLDLLIDQIEDETHPGA